MVSDNNDPVQADHALSLPLLVGRQLARGEVSRLELTHTITDLVYSPRWNWLLASFTTFAASPTNYLAAINPSTLLVEKVFPLELRPDTLALSEEDGLLYVSGSLATNPVVVVNLASWTLEKTFSPGGYVYDMRAMPGNPGILGTIIDISDPTLVFFQDGLPLPLEQPQRAASQFLEFSTNANRLYTFGWSRGSYDIFTLSNNTLTLLSSPPVSLVFDQELVFSDDKRLLSAAEVLMEAETGRVLGRFPQPKAMPASTWRFDSANNRAYAISTNRLFTYELSSQVPLGIQNLGEVTGGGHHLVRWGEDGLAFHTRTQLVVMRNATLPAGLAELSLNLVDPPAAALKETPFSWTFAASNSGPTTASNVVIALNLPATAKWVGASSSQGTNLVAEEMAYGYLGSLAPGQSASLSMQISPLQSGPLQVTAKVASDTLDPDLSNNSLTHLVPVGALPLTGTNSWYNYPAAALVYGRKTDTLYASIKSNSLLYGNGIVALDPATMLPKRFLATGGEPTLLAVGNAEDRLYVYLSERGEVAMVDLDSWTITKQFPIPEGVLDLQVKPDDARFLAVQALGPPGSAYYGVGPLRVYGDGTLLPNQLPKSIQFASIRFAPQPSPLLFGNARKDNGGAFLRIQLSASGAELLDDRYTPFSLRHGPMEASATKIFLSQGGVFDPVTTEMQGSFAYGVGVMDLAAGRLFSLQTGFLKAYDPNTLELLDQELVTEAVSIPKNLIRWGQDGFACIRGNQIGVFRSRLLGSRLEGDLAVEISSLSTNHSVGDTLSYAVTARNMGTTVIRSVQLSLQLPPYAVLLGAEPGQGRLLPATNGVKNELAVLSPGQSATLWVDIKPLEVGPFLLSAGILGNHVELSPANNEASLRDSIGLRWTGGVTNSLNHKTSALASDKVSGLLYALVSGADARHPNDVLALDPQSGRVTNTRRIPNQSGKMTLDETGKYLYVCVNSNTALQRLSLPGLEPDLFINVTNHFGMEIFVIGNLQTRPGYPEEVALSSFQQNWVIPSLVLFKNDSLLPSWIHGSDYIPDFHFTPDGNTLYGFPHYTSGLGLRRIGVSSNGLTWLDSILAPFNENDTDLDLAAGMIYFSSGKVLDLAEHRLITQLFNCNSQTQVLADTNSQRMFYLKDNVLDVYRINSHSQIGTFALTNVMEPISSLVFWGADGLAFRTPSQLILRRGPLFPEAGPADLSLSLSQSSPFLKVGDTSSWTFTLQNLGPNPASNVVFTLVLSSNLNFVSGEMTRGQVSGSGPVIKGQLNQLAAGESSQFSVGIRAKQGGYLVSQATLSSQSPDPHPDNDQLRVGIQAGNLMNRGDLALMNFRLQNLIYDPHSQRIYASVAWELAPYIHQLVAIDPATGLITGSTAVKPEPGKLALSDDGRYLYVAVNQGREVQRLKLPELAVDLSFALPQQELLSEVTVGSMQVQPGHPEILVVSQTYLKNGPGFAGLVVYKDGVALPKSLQGNSGPASLTFSTNSSLLYGYDIGSTFYRLELNELGLSLKDATPNLLSGYQTLQQANELIYTSAGAVLDPTTLTRLGIFYSGLIDTATSQVLADTAQDRLFFSSGVSKWSVHALGSRSEVGAFFLGLSIRPTGEIVRWGADGLAYISSNKLVLLRTVLAPLLSTLDADRDGMPDDYEDAHGFNPNLAADGALDTDGDGAGNGLEYQFGTDPRQAASVLRLQTESAGNGLALRFQSVAGKTYQLEWTENLISNQWHATGNSVGGNNGEVRVTDPNTSPSGPRFYRIRLLP